MTGDHVTVESVTVHALELKGCGLCGHDLTVSTWYVVGKETRRCSLCHKRLGPSHAICPNCGAHNRLVRA